MQDACGNTLPGWSLFKGSKSDGPLFYLEFDSARAWLGVGMKAFPSPELGRYRAALSDRRALADLERLVATVEEDGREIVGERLSRVPAGCPDHPLSLQKGLFASFGLDDVGLVASARFTKIASARFCKHVGFYDWLTRYGWMDASGMKTSSMPQARNARG